MINLFFFKLTLFFYFTGTVLFLAYLVSKKEAASRYSVWVTGAGFAVHTIALVARLLEAGYVPLASLFEAMSFFSWALVLAFLIVELRYRVHILGSFILPMAFVSLVSAATFPTEIRALSPQYQTSWRNIHTSLSVLGSAAFALAFTAGLMYLIQERLLKSKTFNSLYHKLPSLELLDSLNQKAILFGFPLLTLGIITGVLWSQWAWGFYWSWDPKQTLTLVTWFFYLGVLHGRLTMGWRARRAALLSVIGFMGVVIIFFGVNLLTKSSHAFG